MRCSHCSCSQRELAGTPFLHTFCGFVKTRKCIKIVATGPRLQPVHTSPHSHSHTHTHTHPHSHSHSHSHSHTHTLTHTHTHTHTHSHSHSLSRLHCFKTSLVSHFINAFYIPLNPLRIRKLAIMRFSPSCSYPLKCRSILSTLCFTP